MIQGTDAWLKARLGKVTASRVIDICKGVKGAYLASRKNYMAEKVIEILTGEPLDNFTNAAMEWGTETEPLARSAYEAETGNMVEEVGFIDHPTINDFGASPDGVVDDDLVLEIKCPNTATHLGLLTGGKVKREYMYQMEAEMMCYNANRCHFWDYDPRLPGNLSHILFAFTYDPDKRKEIEFEVNKFNAELDEMLKKLKKL